MQNLMCASRTLFDEFAQTEREYRAREAELQREIDALRTRVAELEERIDDQDETFEQIDTILAQTQDRFFSSSREYGYEVGPSPDIAIHQEPVTWRRNFVNAIRHWYECLDRIRFIVIER